MEVTQVAGVRTRARTMADETVVKNSRALKKRKLGNEKLKPTFVETKTLDFEIHVMQEEPSDSCDAAARLRSPAASCCSRTGSMEKPTVSDNQKEEETVETARYFLEYRNESVPTSEFRAESGQSDSTTPETNNSRRRVLQAEKMPSETELEEFFAAAQEGLNKRFKNKYNYDIVNDIPLKGRFEWIQVNPAGK